MIELIKYMKASVALQVQLMLPSEDRRKPEVVLAAAGLSHVEIAEILGKRPAAVQKAVSRANASR